MSFWSNPGQSISNAVSQVSNVVSSIGQSISDLGVQIDKSVNSVVPGGWAMVGAIALTALSLGSIDLEPEVAAGAAGEAAVGTGAGATAGTAGASMTGTAGLGGAAGTGLTTGAGASAGLTAGSGALSTGVAGLGGAAGTGLTVGGIGAGATSALQAMAVAAGTGALYGGGAGGVNALISGTDPLKGIVIGAVMGGLTAGAANGLTSALTASGVDSAVAPYMANALVGASKSVAQGADPLTVLENMSLSTGLSALSSSAKSILNAEGANPVLSNIVANTGTGAIGSAVKGGDVGTGAFLGALNSAASQTIGAVKGAATDAYNTLTAPSASAAPSDPNAYGPVSPVQAGDPTALQSQYLTTQAQQILEQGQALQPTIAQQQAELAAAGSKANDLYTQAASDKTAMYDAINSTYNPAYANVADLQGKAASMYSQVEALQATYDTNKAAYVADSTNKTAFNAANDAANQLNTLIPQYNTAAETFTTANTALENLYTAQIAPLVQTYQASNSALGDQLKTFVADQNALQNTSTQYSGIVNDLNTISTGKLASDMNAPVVSMQAPSASGFTTAELAAIQQGQQDATNAAGTGTQSADTTGGGYLPPPVGTVTVDTNYQPDTTGAGNPKAPIEPAAFADSSSPTGYSGNDGEPVNQDGSPYVPANSDQAIQDQLLADAAANQQGTTGGTTGGTAPVTPTPVDTGALPVTPTPVDTGALPVTPTPVSTGALPVTPTPVSTGALPVTPTPVDTGTTPVTPTPSTTDFANLPVASPATGGVTAPANGGLPTDTGTATTGSDTGTATTGSDTGTATTGSTATTGGGTATTGGGTATTGSGTATTSSDAATAAAAAAIVAALTGTGSTSTGTGSTSTGTGSTSTGTGSTSTGTYNTTPASGLSATTLATPKATLVKGTQIASPLGSFNIPTVDYGTPAANPNSLAEIQNAAQGGIMHLVDGGSTEGELPMKPSLIKGKQVQHANLFGLSEIPLYKVPSFDKTSTFAQGGSIPKGHNPQFYSEGGLGSMQNKYVQGPGTGTSDSIPAMLSNGEFVIPADVVSSLGDGSNDGGAKVLDALLKTIRAHKQKHDSKHLPPDSKGALGYLLEAKRKVRS